jgi:hypothetical protein
MMQIKQVFYSSISLSYPTKFGSIVDERAFVRMGVLFFSASDRLGKATKKGPVGSEDVMLVRRVFRILSLTYSPFQADLALATADGSILLSDSSRGEQGDSFKWYSCPRYSKRECQRQLR